MRIQPIIQSYNIKTSNNKKQTQFESKNNGTSLNSSINNHQYTGNVSEDLAYASMFDNSIANDLKLMGLI